MCSKTETQKHRVTPTVVLDMDRLKKLGRFIPAMEINCREILGLPITSFKCHG
jgi:hypothetical protein